MNIFASYRNACNIVLASFPELKRADLPRLQRHATMTSCVASCHFSKNFILVSMPFYNASLENARIYDREIFLHELAHFIAAKLYCHYYHGKAWQSVCKKLGILARTKIEVDFP